MKTTEKYKIVEFMYGFAVLYKGKRIALCPDEETAEAVVSSGRKTK